MADEHSPTRHPANTMVGVALTVLNIQMKGPTEETNSCRVEIDFQEIAP